MFSVFESEKGDASLKTYYLINSVCFTIIFITLPTIAYVLTATIHNVWHFWLAWNHLKCIENTTILHFQVHFHNSTSLKWNSENSVACARALFTNQWNVAFCIYFCIYIFSLARIISLLCLQNENLFMKLLFFAFNNGCICIAMYNDAHKWH